MCVCVGGCGCMRVCVCVCVYVHTLPTPYPYRPHVTPSTPVRLNKAGLISLVQINTQSVVYSNHFTLMTRDDKNNGPHSHQQRSPPNKGLFRTLWLESANALTSDNICTCTCQQGGGGGGGGYHYSLIPGSHVTVM